MSLRPGNGEHDKILFNEISVLCVFVTPFLCLKPLVGKWKNELGSVMIIEPSASLSFDGSYETNVGANQFLPLYGVMNPMNTANPTFTFCVSWDLIKKGM